MKTTTVPIRVCMMMCFGGLLWLFMLLVKWHLSRFWRLFQGLLIGVSLSLGVGWQERFGSNLGKVAEILDKLVNASSTNGPVTVFIGGIR